MPRILTVDDSSTIRSIITKQMMDLGLEVDHAENGQEGLDKLQQAAIDLILLDVTMPVMDGPTMLAAMRERGNHTPVIMLSSESKRTIVAGAMKLGVEDYVLKPFKPDELRGKVVKVLRLERGTGAPPIAAATPDDDRDGGPAPAGTPCDLLIVDDMDNVHKKLRALVPPEVGMVSCTNPRDAVAACKTHAFRVVVIDLVIPDVDSSALLAQLQALQPQATKVALSLRSAGDVGDVRGQGFSDLMYKPFDAASVDAFLRRHLGGR